MTAIEVEAPLHEQVAGLVFAVWEMTPRDRRHVSGWVITRWMLHELRTHYTSNPWPVTEPGFLLGRPIKEVTDKPATMRLEPL